MQSESARANPMNIGYANGAADAGDANILAQTRMLRKNARTALLANCILAGAVTYVMRGAVEAPVLFAWLAALFGLNGAHFCILPRAGHRKTPITRACRGRGRSPTAPG